MKLEIKYQVKNSNPNSNLNSNPNWNPNQNLNSNFNPNIFLCPFKKRRVKASASLSSPASSFRCLEAPKRPWGPNIEQMARHIFHQFFIGMRKKCNFPFFPNATNEMKDMTLEALFKINQKFFYYMYKFINITALYVYILKKPAKFQISLVNIYIFLELFIL